MRYTIGLLVFPDFQILDAAGPLSVFEVAGYFARGGSDSAAATAVVNDRPKVPGSSEIPIKETGSTGPGSTIKSNETASKEMQATANLSPAITANPTGYEVRLLSAEAGLITSSCGAALQTESFKSPRFTSAIDTLMVIGGNGVHYPGAHTSLVDFLRSQAPHARRVTSVCSGAFLLARTGLLAGRQATTHWRLSRRFAEQFPDVRAVPDKIFVNDGKYWSSAGVTAGIDLALALVAQDFGNAVAQATAREIVIYYRRPGGQSQFSTIAELGAPGHRFAELLGWVREHIAEPLQVEDLAQRMAMSPRNFSRQFLKVVGRSPAKAIEQIRLEVAQNLVETTSLSMTKIAEQTGYQDGERMRRSFVRSLGRAPRALRTGVLQVQKE